MAKTQKFHGFLEIMDADISRSQVSMSKEQCARSGECSLLEEARLDVFKKHVFVCLNDKPCGESGAASVVDALRKEIAARGLKKEIRINKAGCFDACGHGPLVVVYPDSVWYARVQPEDCLEIIDSHLVGGVPVKRLLYDGSGRIA